MFCVIGKALLLFPQLYMLPSKELAFEAVGIFVMAHAKMELSHRRSLHCFSTLHADNLRRNACAAIYKALAFLLWALSISMLRECPVQTARARRIEYTNVSDNSKTHISLAAVVCDIGKQCRTRSDAAERGV